MQPKLATTLWVRKVMRSLCLSLSLCKSYKAFPKKLMFVIKAKQNK